MLDHARVQRYYQDGELSCRDGRGSQAPGGSQAGLRYLAWGTGRRLVAKAEIVVGQSGEDAALGKRVRVILDL